MASRSRFSPGSLISRSVWKTKYIIALCTLKFVHVTNIRERNIILRVKWGYRERWRWYFEIYIKYAMNYRVRIERIMGGEGADCKNHVHYYTYWNRSYNNRNSRAAIIITRVLRPSHYTIISFSLPAFPGRWSPPQLSRYSRENYSIYVQQIN